MDPSHPYFIFEDFLRKGKPPKYSSDFDYSTLGLPPNTSEPSFNGFSYVRWRGTQWFENSGLIGDPVTVNITTSWKPLRTPIGESITYGIGGMNRDKTQSNHTLSASRYLGPWYSNIDIYIESWVGGGTAGEASAFQLWELSPTEGLQSGFTYPGFSYSRSSPDTSNFAESRGRWEFAGDDLEVITTWEGYSLLREAF